MALITRQLGATVFLTYHDVPLFDSARARKLAGDIARSHMQLALMEIAGHISDEAPVGISGNLAQSFTGAGGFGGMEIDGSGLEDLEGRVFSSLPYAIVIDQGRTPGARMPPVDAIMLWVERTFGISGNFDDDELEQVAWAVAKSIQRKGIAPRRFVEKGTANALPRVEGILRIMAQAIAVGLVTPQGRA